MRSERLNRKRYIESHAIRMVSPRFFFFFSDFWISSFTRPQLGWVSLSELSCGLRQVNRRDVHALPNRENASSVAVKILGARWERGLLAYRVRGVLPGKY